jgi:hypothetical protein
MSDYKCTDVSLDNELFHEFYKPVIDRERIRTLIAAGADVNVRSKCGDSLLQRAITNTNSQDENPTDKSCYCGRARIRIAYQPIADRYWTGHMENGHT